MTKKLSTFLFSMIVLFSAPCFAQVQFSGAGSLLKGSGYYNNHAYLLGGGLSVKYVFRDRYLIGATARNYQANTTAYEHFNASDKQSNISGTIEMIFNRTKQIKPFLGVDAGIAKTSHMINYFRHDNSSAFIGGRGGLYYSIGQSTGLFGQMQYNYVSGDGVAAESPGVVNSVLTEGINKHWTFDVGVFIRLYIKVKTNK